MAYNKETGMYEGYIYKIVNDINNKVYIGQTSREIKYRIQEHFKKANQNNPNNKGTVLYSALLKYGEENFSIYEVEKFIDNTKEGLIKQLNIAEINYIQYFNCLAPYGYNVSKGGSGRSIRTEFVIDKYSLDGLFLESYYTKVEAALSVGNNGIHYSSITDCCNGKLNYAYGYVWRNHGDSFDKFEYKDETLTPVDKYSYTGILIKSYKSMSEAAKELNIYCNGKLNTSAIRQCCLGNIYTAYEFVWRFKGESFDKYPIQSSKKRRKVRVNKYSFDGTFLESYESISLAAKKNNVRDSGIYQCCKHVYSNSGGYVWFFADDISQPNKLQIVIN